MKLVNPVDTMGAGDSFIAAFIVTLLRFGWKDNNKLTENEILSAFEKASNYSADICMIEGAYGYGKPIKERDNYKIKKYIYMKIIRNIIIKRTQLSRES